MSFKFVLHCTCGWHNDSPCVDSNTTFCYGTKLPREVNVPVAVPIAMPVAVPVAVPFALRWLA